MLLMDRNFNPFATCMSCMYVFRYMYVLNKQGHIINGNIPVALRCVTFFSHTRVSHMQVSLPQFFSHTKELLIIANEPAERRREAGEAAAL